LFKVSFTVIAPILEYNAMQYMAAAERTPYKEGKAKGPQSITGIHLKGLESNDTYRN